MRTRLKEDILRLRSEGKSYRQIQIELGCSKSVICFHVAAGQKEKSKNRGRKNYKTKHGIVGKKLSNFLSRSTSKDRYRSKRTLKINLVVSIKINAFTNRSDKMQKGSFGVKEVLEKLGDNPICYLTGTPIDLADSNSYHFDHVKPVFLGGDNSLDNLNICIAKANRSKSDMSVEEYLYLCKQVLEHNGYKIEARE